MFNTVRILNSMILVNTKTEYFVSDGGLVSRQEFWKVLPQSQEAFLLLLKRLITGVLTAMIMAGMCASAISAAEEKKVEDKKVNYQSYAADLE